MPPLPPWPSDRRELYELGVRRMTAFCRLNGLAPPAAFVVPKEHWYFDACAFYRPDTDAVRSPSAGERKMRERGYGPGVNVCLERCGRPCGDQDVRNWSWPASVTDRTVYGVVLHELGHHCDWAAGANKGRYHSEYSSRVRAEAGEPPLTSYAATNPAEYLAEAMRLFVSNPDLLRHVRPRTFAVLARRWVPPGSLDWRAALRGNVPDRVVRSLRNKGAP